MKNRIPKISKWLVSKIQSDYNHSPALGDLTEEFQFISEKEGFKKAKCWFRWQVIISIPSFLKHNLCWSAEMFRNYFKITLRSIKKQKIYSFINLAGLSSLQSLLPQHSHQLCFHLDLHHWLINKTRIYLFRKDPSFRFLISGAR